MNTTNIWLFDGALDDAITLGRSLPLADDLGYVYVLALSNRTCKLGSTRHFAQRLTTHRSEVARYGISIARCSITRPHFNYRAVEQQSLRSLVALRQGEVVRAPYAVVQAAVEMQTPEFVARANYGADHRAGWAFCQRLVDELSAPIGLAPEHDLTKHVEQLLDTHRELGRRSGLSEAASVRNALAVIEAHTGLDLSSLRRAVEEVA